MLPKKFIEQVKQLAYSEAERYQVLSKFHIDLSVEKGQWLAGKLGADKDIVQVGTLLMDCMLGKAYSEGRLPDHVEMSVNKTQELLNDYPDIDENTKQNIIHCVKQHHGVKEFHSLESEICCNADCYRFASVKGLLGGFQNTLDMSIDDLVQLYSEKADEKWNALSLEICKQELESQYKAIKKLLSKYFKQ